MQLAGAGDRVAAPTATPRSALARPAGLARLRISLALAILTSIAAASALWSYAPLSLSGRLVDIEGRPVAGATIRLLAGPRVDSSAVSDSGGRWALAGGHRIDAHQLLLSAPGFLPLAVAVGDEPSPSRRSFALHRLPDVAGSVVDESGAAVAGAEVAFEQPGRPGAWSVNTGGDGSFALARTLPPGVYQLTVTALDHDGWRTTVDLRADGQVSVAAVIPRQLGTIELTTNPSGLHPWLDGRPLAGCAATPCTVSIPVGSHSIQISPDLYLPWQQQLKIADRQTVNVSATLERKQGTLRVSAPPGGEISVDGNPVEVGGWSGRLPTGVHTVVVRSPGHWPAAAQVSVDWNQEATVALLSLTAIVPGDQAGFLAGLDAYLKKAGGHYGIYLEDLRSGTGFGYHEDDVMEAASDIKLPLALFLLHEVDVGVVKLEDKLALQDSDFMGGTGILNGTAASGDQFATGDLLRLMIEQSDNTAWQALQRALGADLIDAYAASIGAPECHQVDDNCTAHQAGLMVSQLYRGQLLKPASMGLLLNLMENTVFNDRINYYLGDLVVAHKTGADGGVMNDVGIVYAPSGAFLVSIFSQTDEGTVQPIRDVARAALGYFAPR